MKERKRGATRKTYAPPNWDEWESRKTGKLYQANALAWDIDPNLIRPENPGASGPFRYQISLGEAVIALMEGQIAGWDKPDLDVPPEHAVGPLADFAGWAEAPPRERKLPKRFPGRATTTGREVVANEEPAQVEPTRPQYSGETPRGLTMKQSKQANWIRKGRIPLWQAVVLSFGVDPDAMQFPQRDFHQIGFVNGRGEGLEDFRRRLEEAESHLGDALPAAEEIKTEIAGVAHRCASTVRLGEFGAWLRSTGVETPSWFPSPPSPEKGAAVNDDGMNARSRASHLAVIDILLGRAGIAISEPFKVGKEIEIAAGLAGISITDRTIADILKNVSAARKARKR